MIKTRFSQHPLNRRIFTKLYQWVSNEMVKRMYKFDFASVKNTGVGKNQRTLFAKLSHLRVDLRNQLFLIT